MPKLVLCYKAIDSQEATLAAMRLEGHGIRTKTVGEGASIGYGDLTVGLLGVEVEVPKDPLMEARAPTKDYLGGG